MSGASSWWAFDRPLHSDGLFWSGLALGLVLAVYGVTSAEFDALPIEAKLVAVAARLVAGVFLVGVLGGAVRNFWRGYRST